MEEQIQDLQIFQETRSPPSWPDTFNKTIKTMNFVNQCDHGNYSRLMRPAEYAKSICKIKIPGGFVATGYSVVIFGVLCIMTNNHAIDTIDTAKGCRCIFRYLESDSKTIEVRLDPDFFFFTNNSNDLDFTIVALVEIVPTADMPPPLELSTTFPFRNGQMVSIWGHPSGQPLTMSSGQITRTEDKTISYASSTLGGSSGSPVFDNMTGQVVALHRSGDESGAVGNTGSRMDKILAAIETVSVVRTAIVKTRFITYLIIRRMTARNAIKKNLDDPPRDTTRVDSGAAAPAFNIMDHLHPAAGSVANWARSMDTTRVGSTAAAPAFNIMNHLPSASVAGSVARYINRK